MGLRLCRALSKQGYRATAPVSPTPNRKERMMNLQDYITNAVKVSRAASFANSNQLTLGEMIAKCEGFDVKEDCTVRFDFEYLAPTGIDSWRGSYDELALSYEERGHCKFKDFLQMLKEAVGREYTGYKGGEFTMSRQTPVWVANYGNSGSTGVLDIVNKGYEVVIITGECEF